MPERIEHATCFYCRAREAYLKEHAHHFYDDNWRWLCYDCLDRMLDRAEAMQIHRPAAMLLPPLWEERNWRG